MFSIGSRIKKIRELSGVTQIDLANKMGISRSQIIKWEGPNSNPGISTLQNIAAHLKVTIQDIIGKDEQKTKLESGEGASTRRSEGVQKSEERELFDQKLHNFLDLILEKGDDDKRFDRIINDIWDLGEKLSNASEKESRILRERAIKRVIGE